MSYNVSYSKNEFGQKQATVELDCDDCHHTGTATYYQVENRSWRRHKLTQNKDGGGSFSQNEYNGDVYCSCVGTLVFSPKRYWGANEAATSGTAFTPRTGAVELALLRRSVGITRRRLAREANVHIRVLRAIEANKVQITQEIAESVRVVLRQRGASDASLSLISKPDLSGCQATLLASADISRSDLTGIERLLSDISGKLSALVSGPPGYDLKAVINRLEKAVSVLGEIESNTRKK